MRRCAARRPRRPDAGARRCGGSSSRGPGPGRVVHPLRFLWLAAASRACGRSRGTVACGRATARRTRGTRCHAGSPPERGDSAGARRLRHGRERSPHEALTGRLPELERLLGVTVEHRAQYTQPRELRGDAALGVSRAQAQRSAPSRVFSPALSRPSTRCLRRTRSRGSASCPPARKPVAASRVPARCAWGC